MSLGKEVFSNFSTHKKMDGNISIEDDVIGVDDAIAKIIWSIYCIEAQGCNISPNKIM